MLTVRRHLKKLTSTYTRVRFERTAFLQIYADD